MSDGLGGVTAPPRVGPNSPSILVLLIGLIITGSLAWLCVSIHDHNESRLLNLELNQAASVVTAAVPSIQIPMSSAAVLAAATNGDPQQFRGYMAPYVGGKGPFVSASLWRVGDEAPTLVAVIGSSPVLNNATGNFLRQATRSPPFSVLNLLSLTDPTIGYASAPEPGSSPWVVFAERVLPADRHLSVTRNSAFSQLNYAIYLGRTTGSSDLLEAATNEFPLPANAAKVTVPFGNSAITLAATPNGELGGTVLARLPWIVALAGGVLTLVAAVLANYLVRRRRQAEWLASENRRMYSEQRSIADILQHALLPDVLPEIPGIETAIRYVAGGEGADVGGDWYDVIPVDDTHFVFVLGDVSGRGVVAATIMARLHFAIRAYVMQGDAPDEILVKLGRLLSIERDKSFATILCAYVDVTGHTITLVNAGHPPLLMLNGRTGDYVRSTVFPPVGVSNSTEYRATTFDVPEGATVVAFTDGLVERRGETIDTGLERLRALTSEVSLPLDSLLTKVLTEATTDGYHDDTAILAVRWMN
jgi:serine phosphatase RsbU (regulator of sigma subunit)